MQRNILDLSFEELVKFLSENNYKPFIAKQIFDWIYQKYIFDFNQMSNLAKSTIEFLSEHFFILQLQPIKTLVDEDMTIKFLFALQDQNEIETVVMNFEYGNSICVTTQVGCNMGCKFCASGKLKKIRNLTAGEILAQVLFANKYLQTQNSTLIRNIVVMGIGEPFDNYDNLKQFLNIVRDQKAVGIGSRKITVSTCGIVKRFDDFMSDFEQVGLAISLHAPNDHIRNELMPINKVYPINQLIAKALEYTTKTNRRVTFEYIMLENINDSKRDALELIELLQDLQKELFTINLIPYNSIADSQFQRSNNTRAFYEILRDHGIITTVRQEKGTKINGACGQLRAANNK